MTKQPTNESLRYPNVSIVAASLRAMDLNVEDEDVRRRIDNKIASEKGNPSGRWYSDSSWSSWIKLSLIEELIFQLPNVHGDFVTAIFHVGFIFIEETPEQVERLRKDDAEFASSVARSKIGSTTLSNVTPVDRVAKRVYENG